VVERLVDAGHEAYPVGGGVRDLLLGRRVVDWDVATAARPEEVQNLFERVIPTGIAHGTVTVLFGKSKIEVTTFRGDLGYSDGRHPDEVNFLKSLPEDLKRRDFTVNAMAWDLGKQRLIDPLGGRRDLKRSLIKAVGEADRRFSEDGLRPMRAVRFACVLGFDIEKQTFEAISKSLKVFRKVAPERIRDELLKILASRQAARGIELLRLSDLLAEIIPEILETVGFEQNHFHRYDVYEHTLKCLERARGDGVLKLAVLLHDIGKPQAAEGPAGERTFYRHEAKSSELAARIMRRLRFSNLERARARKLIEEHMFHYEPQWTDGAVRRLVRRVGPDRLEDLWEMRRADAWGRGMGVRDTLGNLKALKNRVAKVLAENATLKVTDLALDGEDVMRILRCGPGPRIGEVLEALLERVLDDPALNCRQELERLIPGLGI